MESKLNKCKTTYAALTTAGKWSNYERSYQMKLFINNTQIPIELLKHWNFFFLLFCFNLIASY